MLGYQGVLIYPTCAVAKCEPYTAVPIIELGGGRIGSTVLFHPERGQDWVRYPRGVEDGTSYGITLGRDDAVHARGHNVSGFSII